MFFLKMQKNDSPNENSNNSKNSSCNKTYYEIQKVLSHSYFIVSSKSKSYLKYSFFSKNCKF